MNNSIYSNNSAYMQAIDTLTEISAKVLEQKFYTIKNIPDFVIEYKKHIHLPFTIWSHPKMVDPEILQKLKKIVLGRTAGLLRPNQPDLLWPQQLVFFYDLHGRIGGTIIPYDQLPVLVALLQDGIQLCTQKCFAIICGHTNTYHNYLLFI